MHYSHDNERIYFEEFAPFRLIQPEMRKLLSEPAIEDQLFLLASRILAHMHPPASQIRYGIRLERGETELIHRIGLSPNHSYSVREHLRIVESKVPDLLSRL